MKKSILLVSAFLLLESPPLEATVYTYRDDSGQIWHVNRVESVPPKYRPQVKQGNNVILVEETQGQASDQMERLWEDIPRDSIPSDYQRRVFLGITVAKLGFKLVRTHIPRIQQGRRTMMWTPLSPPVMTVSKKRLPYHDLHRRNHCP